MRYRFCLICLLFCPLYDARPGRLVAVGGWLLDELLQAEQTLASGMEQFGVLALGNECQHLLAQTLS